MEISNLEIKNVFSNSDSFSYGFIRLYDTIFPRLGKSQQPTSFMSCIHY